MLTLFQFLTWDSIGAIYRPLLVGKPLLIIYFISFILMISICLLNLVTAALIETALEQGRQDREAEKAWEAARRQRVLPRLKEMFNGLDADHSGELELEE